MPCCIEISSTLNGNCLNEMSGRLVGEMVVRFRLRLRWRGRAQMRKEFPADDGDQHEGDDHPREIAQHFAHHLYTVAEEFAEQDVKRHPQGFAQYVVEKKARP